MELKYKHKEQHVYEEHETNNPSQEKTKMLLFIFKCILYGHVKIHHILYGAHYS